MGFSTSRTRVAAGSTNWAGDSDERLKENIQTSSAGLSFINDLRPVTFDWKKKGEVDSSLASYKEGSDIRVRETDSLNKHGFIAQEVKTALDNHSEVLGGSEIWQEDSVDGTQGLSLVALVPMLVKALQEADDKIDALTTRIAALES
jgi:trimeric autotransporter adhesin